MMQFFTDSNMQFPLVELTLNQGETVFIQRGSMVYHTPNVTLSTRLNASGSGLGRLVKAVGRSEERRVGKECRSRWSPYH